MIDDIPFLPEATPCPDGSFPLAPAPPPVPLRIEPGAKFACARIRAIAEKVVAALAPLCDRIEIAGSLRRHRPLVGDIDLVILPKDRAAIRAKLVPACTLIADGSQNLIVDFLISKSERLQLDIFFAHAGKGDLFGQSEPSNWGTLLLCRTGSKQFNIWFAKQAIQAGYHWSPYRGLIQAEQVVASETEEEIFAALGLSSITPASRER
jgi:DNA polymerase (family X)